VGVMCACSEWCVHVVRQCEFVHVVRQSDCVHVVRLSVHGVRRMWYVCACSETVSVCM